MAPKDAPAVVLGTEGVGKTWAVFDWLIGNQSDLPIVLVAPSSSVRTLSSSTESDIRRYLGDRLFELTGSRDAEHWRRRLNRLLKRPIAEGPVLAIFIDGLNQHPSGDWAPLLQALQSEPFAGRVRVIVTTRDLHFKTRLQSLKDLYEAPARVLVDRYEISVGGELDQRLAIEGLARVDLPGDLLDLARTPRLFSLVVTLRDRLRGLQQVTLHTLLWEYGRDTTGVVTNRTFDESSWRAWLQEIAKRYRDGTRTYTLRELGETTARPDLTPNDTFKHLSDIIDGRFATQNAHGQIDLAPTIVGHALGSAVLATLDSISTPAPDTVEQYIANWFDPISGLDQKADILRAAVSILLARDVPPNQPILSGLIGEWLRTQNVPEEHRAEIRRLAEPLCDALLDVLWRNEPFSRNSVNDWAIEALRSVPRDNQAVFQKLVSRLTEWLQTISRDVEPANNRQREAEESRSRRFVRNLGFDADGQHNVLGLPLSIVEHRRMPVKAAIPSLLDGYPLLPVVPLLETAALHFAILGHDECWDGLKWLCLLNPKDSKETTAALRARSAAVSSLAPEPGVAKDLPKRVAALLLWMTGEEDDEADAGQLNPRGGPSYEERYLNDPLGSHYALERRHVDLIFRAHSVPLFRKYRRLEPYFSDPNVQPPADFCNALAKEELSLDVEKLDTGINMSAEDHTFERLAPVLARCTPQTLSVLVRRKLAGFGQRPASQRFACAIRSNEHILLADTAAAHAAYALRIVSKEADETNELYAASRLLALEIIDLPGPEQIETLISANLKHIVDDLDFVLRPLTAREVELLLGKYEHAPAKQASDLLMLLCEVTSELEGRAWAWISTKAMDPTCEHRGVAFTILCTVDAERFGRELAQRGWSWSKADDPRCNHYGSLALIAATVSRPFDQVATNIAPWLLLKAVSDRGSSPADAQFAADVLSDVLDATTSDVPDLGSDITIDRQKRAANPFVLGVAPHVADDDPFRALRNSDEDAEARSRAINYTLERIRGAQKSGASLFLQVIDPKDCRPLLQHASAAVTNWLDGMSARTLDFQRRVRLAEGLFVALCEALLEFDPARGEALWRALREALRTRFKDGAGVNELTNMLFRTKQTPAGLLEEQMSLSSCSTDEAAFNLALSAQAYGRTDWLDEVVSRETATGISWRIQRARILAGFRTKCVLPVPGAWPEEEFQSSREVREWEAARWRHKDACAHHWWDQYWSVASDEDAYAAWNLMLETVDRRSNEWMRIDATATSLPQETFRRRLIHFQMNDEELVRAMKKNLKSIASNFLGHRIFDGIGPWT